MEKIEKSEFDYDFFVIGGGSGGLSAAKQASSLGAKVGLADYVKPTPIGTKWGLGGTCVNVGCIPKKLMHYAGLTYDTLDELEYMGFPEKIKKEHNWETMISKIQTYIKKLNFGYKAQLRSKAVTYHNSYATFIDKNTILLKDANGKENKVTAKNVLVAIGGRPNYNDIPGSKEHCITSDDLFSLKKSPGKTLVVGASYIALECGGFLAALGYNTNIMVRSILLRGFDQDMAQRIGSYMQSRHVNFINKANPISFSKNDQGKIICEFEQEIDNKKEIKKEEYDTVLLAIGRYIDTKAINADRIGLNIAKNGKLITNDHDQTNIENIFSIGDCAEGRPELTPPAIMAGKLLANRLFGNSKKLMNYRNVATVVFTPLEYGAIGYSEEDAIKEFGNDKIKVYHSEFTPLEWNYNIMRGETGYLKLVCTNDETEKVLGFHIVSPNAGEITQGISVAMNMGLTKKNLDETVGIHPTVAEEFTTVTGVKGVDDGKKDGC